MPGRLRLRIETKLPSANIEAWFRSIPGIYSASYTPITKSLLLYYDEQFQPHLFLEMLKERKRESKKAKQDLSIKKRVSLISLCAVLFCTHWMMTKMAAPAFYMTLLNRIMGAVVLLLSLPTIKNGLRGMVKERKFNPDFLTMSSLIACLYLNQSASALVIYIMSTASELLTDMTTVKTKAHLQSLLHLEAPYAWKILEDDTVSKVSVDDVSVEDIVKVYQGERIPVDGFVLNGHAVIDESAITGEYMPKEKTVQDEVYAGSICQSGEITLCVTKTGRETALGRMIQLIENAYSSKAPIQEYANKIAEKMVGVSFALTFITYLFTRNLNRALSMLVIDFVCGIKLSTAAAFSAAIGKAAKKGVLIKNGSYVEQLANVETFVFDKTGTMTEGKPYVEHMECFHDFTAEEVLQKAALLEQTSPHPLAYAIIEEAKKRNIPLVSRLAHEKVNVVTGKGLYGIIEEREVHVGSLRYLEEEGIITEHYIHLSPTYSVYVAIDGYLAGAFSIQDRIRTGMKHTIKQLRLLGVQKVVMLTGDEQKNAEKVARQLQLDDYCAHMLPEEKVRYVENEKKRTTIAMVGDGMNDAPALTKAHIGITLGGKRTDLAVEASDIVVSKDDPYVLTELVDLSKETLCTVKQNVLATLFINGAAILLGSLGIISPVAGAAVHNLATIGVVLNSMKILAKEEKQGGTFVYDSSRYTRENPAASTNAAKPLLI
ncbi:heavy metal translocating P-type ATPase [Bacillus songklensis]|uniref:heavy metal translocating P-type ATPase n=1 Tax=Bacillus songklensis TaxID=1069116 RepID=UPI00366AE0C4